MVIGKTIHNKLRKRLLMESGLTLQKTQEIGRLFESTEQQNKEISNVKPTQHDQVEDRPEHVNKIAQHKYKSYHKKDNRTSQFSQNQTQKKTYNKQTECGRCGMNNHTSNECRRSKDRTCKKCGIKGHFAKMCRTKIKTDPKYPL